MVTTMDRQTIMLRINKITPWILLFLILLAGGAVVFVLGVYLIYTIYLSLFSN